MHAETVGGGEIPYWVTTYIPARALSITHSIYRVKNVPDKSCSKRMVLTFMSTTRFV